MARNVLRSNEASAEPLSPTSTWSWVRSTGLTRRAMRSECGDPWMCRVPSATVAVNDGAAAATGAAAIEVTRAASATPPSNGFLVMSYSCLRFRFESAAANDRIGEDRAKAIRRSGPGRFQRMVGGFPADLLGQLQECEELAQKAFELLDLGRIEPFEELPIADREGGDRLIDDVAPFIRQLDDHAPAIIGVVESTHESSMLESVDPARDARRRQHQAL